MFRILSLKIITSIKTLLIDDCCHFSGTMASKRLDYDGPVEKTEDFSLQIVNGHYQLRCSHPINLRDVHCLLATEKTCKLHQGRPTMLSCRLMTKRVQFFPNGSIQILGGRMTRAVFYHLYVKIHHLLKTLNSAIHLTRWTTNNIVVHFSLKNCLKFDNVSCNKDLTYEPELFPALLVTKWPPVHVTLFPNGKGMITGIKRRQEAQAILQNLLLFLTDYVYLCRL